MKAEAVRSALRTRVVGSDLRCEGSVESTNDLAWRAGLEGAPEGLVILAEEQTRGRGRFGRTWFGPAGQCLLGSVLLRPKIRLEEANLVTAIGALAIGDALAELCGLRTKIRFPNDLLVEDRKISGILVEARLISSMPDFFIIGMGVNANVQREAFPEEIRPDATSILAETGAKSDLNRLAATVLGSLDDWAGRLGDETGHARIQSGWKERSALLGRGVEIREAGRTVRGKVEDIDVFTGLLIRTESGHVRHARAEHIEQVRIQKNDD